MSLSLSKSNHLKFPFSRPFPQRSQQQPAQASAHREYLMLPNHSTNLPLYDLGSYPVNGSFVSTYTGQGFHLPTPATYSNQHHGEVNEFYHTVPVSALAGGYQPRSFDLYSPCASSEHSPPSQSSLVMTRDVKQISYSSLQEHHHKPQAKRAKLSAAIPGSLPFSSSGPPSVVENGQSTPIFADSDRTNTAIIAAKQISVRINNTEGTDDNNSPPKGSRLKRGAKVKLAEPLHLIQRPESEENRSTYQLLVRQHPLHARMCGFGEKDRRPIDPPPLVQLFIRDDKGDDANTLQNPFFVLHVTLWSEDGNEERNIISNSPKCARILMGSLVSSPSLLKNNEGERGLYFAFPDLSIRTEGRYTLKFSLMKLGRYGFAQQCNIFQIVQQTNNLR
ncbi:hypothetical protein BC937DRAFT_91402 [Endogone sp. FLAS-F59071]|nr:hypothetical protein BC937DRAFT_91402 [Endogone sp. FLAS-F59071]|eukprot:RUS21810.1 hypothetical protein BC937DRAFT_91402 [Endogone sp. FLAS-F59071]